MNILLQYAIAKISTGSGKDIDIPTTSPADIIANILNVTYFVAAVIAVVVIILAGMSFVTSSGNAAGVTKAKNAILYAVIGLVVILAAFVITQYVIGRF